MNIDIASDGHKNQLYRGITGGFVKIKQNNRGQHPIIKLLSCCSVPFCALPPSFNLMWGCQNLKHHALIGCHGILNKYKLGKRIKELRNRLGITQEELAEKSKTSYKYIQRIEGKTNPPDIRLTTIERLAKALKTTPSKLLNC